MCGLESCSDVQKAWRDEGKKFALNMRTTQEIRTKLEAAAAASGKSLAQEAEARLEKSFDQTAEALLGLVDGDRRRRVLSALSRTSSMLSLLKGQALPPTLPEKGLRPHST